MNFKTTLFTFFLLFFSTLVSIAQTEEVILESFFEENDTLELYGESFAGLELLDSQLKNNKIFITGENHTFTESNARLWLKMIKYLHKHAGVRNVMFEYGFSYGWLVNEYLQTGDTNLYNSIKNFAYIEYSNVIKELRDYNASLDSSERIYLCAIDIERGVYPIAKLLDYLLPDEYDAHDSIILHLESISSLASYNDHKLQQEESNLSYVNYNFLSNPTLDLIHENFIKFEEEYKKVLAGNFDLFKSVITEKYLARKLWNKYDDAKAVQQYVYRENYMHKRFLIEQAEHPGNWFGQFGRCHTTQTKQNSNSCDWFMFKSLANRIKNTKGDLFKDSVMTIGIVYERDRNMGVDREQYEELFDEYFESVPEGRIVLFDLSKDSTIDSVYGEDFDYVFLNTNTKKGEVYETVFDLYDYDLDYMPNFKATLNYVRNSFSDEFSLLNDELSNANIGTFSPQLYAIELNFLTGASDMPVYSGSQIGVFIPQTATGTDNDIEYKLSGFYIKNQVFYNLTESTAVLDIMPGIGYGFERLTLKAQEYVGNPNLNMGSLGEARSIAFYNPAFVVDGYMIADINISRFTVGFQWGYTLDVSDQHWRSDGELLYMSPPTSLSRMSQTVRVGFNF